MIRRASHTPTSRKVSPRASAHFLPRAKVLSPLCSPTRSPAPAHAPPHTAGRPCHACVDIKTISVAEHRAVGQKSQSITIHALLARQVLLKTAETRRYLQESGTMECSDHVSQWCLTDCTRLTQGTLPRYRHMALVRAQPVSPRQPALVRVRFVRRTWHNRRSLARLTPAVHPC
jgi:hypothetical protein